MQLRALNASGSVLACETIESVKGALLLAEFWLSRGGPLYHDQWHADQRMQSIEIYTPGGYLWQTWTISPSEVSVCRSEA